MSTTDKRSHEQLKAFELERPESAESEACEECMHEVTDKERDRLQLRRLLMAASASVSCGPVGHSYFEGLRQRARGGR